jgi:hypothetical protein
MKAFARGAAMTRQLFEILDKIVAFFVHCGQQDGI